MVEIISLEKINDYEHLKSALNTELKSAAISFIRIGYLLKIARDTDLLKDTEYQDVNEFAAKEFGLDKSQVSRFMSINDRFSIGGYSEHLEDKYSEMGSSKLSLMLLLPDAINEQISPKYSKSDIQAIKEEYQAEQNISDLEVMMEPKPETPQTENDEFIALIVKQMVEEHPEPAKVIKWGMDAGLEIKESDAKDAYIHDGDCAFSIRISGMGRFLVSCKESGLNITNMRSEENTPLSWEEFTKVLVEELSHREFEKQKEEPKKKSKSKVKKSTSTEGKPHSKGNHESTKSKDSKEEKPEEVSDPESETIPTDETQSTRENREDVQKVDTVLQSEDINEDVPVEPDGVKKGENEAAAFKKYGRFIQDSRTIRQNANQIIGTLEDKNRLINDVPPINKVYLFDLQKDIETLKAAVERIIDIWNYYEEQEYHEEQEDEV